MEAEGLRGEHSPSGSEVAHSCGSSFQGPYESLTRSTSAAMKVGRLLAGDATHATGHYAPVRNYRQNSCMLGRRRPQHLDGHVTFFFKRSGVVATASLRFVALQPVQIRCKNWSRKKRKHMI